MVFLLFALSIAVLEAILHADKNRQRRPKLGVSDREHPLPAPDELLLPNLKALPQDLKAQSQDLRAQSQDLKALMRALHNHAPAKLPLSEPVVRDKGV